MEIPIKLDTFFKVFGLREPPPPPAPPGNSNPFCGGRMDIFWNCTLPPPKRLFVLELYVSVPLSKGTLNMRGKGFMSRKTDVTTNTRMQRKQTFGF